MQGECITETVIVLKLSEKEATILKEFVRNSHVNIEEYEVREVRTSLFRTLTKALEED